MTLCFSQGNPPFEKPSIAKGITNFVLYKFGHLPQKDWQTMYDLAKMFLHCLNHWKLEPPAARRQVMSQDEISAYKVVQVNGGIETSLELTILLFSGELHKVALLLPRTSLL